MTRPSASARAAVLVAAALLGWPAATVHGQATALQQRLATAARLRCTFTVQATGTWAKGVASAEVAARTIEVAFDEVNVDEGTAQAEGVFGESYIVVRQLNDYLHLMQTHSSGAVYTTTVVARDAGDGKLLAVHTRHEYTDVRLPGYTSRPEMYVGSCQLG